MTWAWLFEAVDSVDPSVLTCDEDEMITLLQNHLQPRAADGEPAVFFHKMRAVTWHCG